MITGISTATIAATFPRRGGEKNDERLNRIMVG
jgi:hypothetical protein